MRVQLPSCFMCHRCQTITQHTLETAGPGPVKGVVIVGGICMDCNAYNQTDFIPGDKPAYIAVAEPAE
jgi:hypothetical protein